MKIISDFWCVWVLFSAFCALQFPDTVGLKQKQNPLTELRQLSALKAHHPQLDGVLDDDIWQTRAPSTKAFVNAIPMKANPASQRTTFQVAYDDEAV